MLKRCGGMAPALKVASVFVLAGLCTRQQCAYRNCIRQRSCMTHPLFEHTRLGFGQRQRDKIETPFHRQLNQNVKTEAVLSYSSTGSRGSNLQIQDRKFLFFCPEIWQLPFSEQSGLSAKTENKFVVKRKFQN